VTGINKRIVWLASYPKSGNTWFRIFLENLLSKAQTPIDINELTHTQIASSRILLDAALGVSSADLTNREIEILRPKAYLQIAKEADELVFIKVHDAWKKNDLGTSMFPENATKAVLYFIRNPLDVAVSFSYHSSKKLDRTISDMNNSNFTFCNDPKKIHNQVQQVLSDWSHHVTSWIDESGLPVHLIKYEDMLSDTEQVFSRALKFLGLHINAERIREAVTFSSFGLLKETEEKKGFNEKPSNMESFFRNGKANIWKDHFNSSQVKEISKNHITQMERFSYMIS
jgi:hypothetical protein